MKSVLISIHPKWCELIASGKKTIEVRKTAPKQVPFKAYIYETYDKKYVDIGICWGNGKCFEHGCKKVIGEFVCDCITPLYNVCTDEWRLLRGGLHEIEKQLVGMACMTEEELHEYANGKYCYAWHISNIKIYDKPRELSEFWSYSERPHKCCDDSWNFSRNSGTNEYSEQTMTSCRKSHDNILICYRCLEKCNQTCHHVTRPPQSWCYVEELL